ncbi:hypothetical protein CNMCM5793_006699 [Aspergillus hiratsukae]|uniref:Uncharacterized protein n=1 Tax=Aspergillus hiratsukae TaxID=1194566 RepID=A0A8H6P588_9EURO|nr:hypothetical protein CNMCM5793_006699 [Aspergillus hiratsukae]KAF7157756.1 hypothetical protein CNMCM6106_003739 [Aspergillus hiratsukae]
MKALQPLQRMASIRFADFQAISTPEEIVPDVCLGLIATDPTPDNVYLVGELKTPWTIPIGCSAHPADARTATAAPRSPAASKPALELVVK